jgi:LacI family transcriptional regulator
LALEEAGIAFDPALVVPGEYHEVSGLQAVDRLLASGQKFTAIFAANDQMAFGAALGLHRHSLRVPEDVSLVGFDDLPTALFAVPPLSTIRHPAYELGRLAATAMLQLIAGEKPTVLVPVPQLIERQSSRRLEPPAI